jgi:hypothetical protein
MPLQLGDFNRGADAIKAAAKGGGKGGGFAPQIKWDVGEEKFVQFLLPIELSPTVLIHEWIDCGTKKVGDKTMTDWGFFLSRTDPVIGEDVDPLTDKGSTPRKRVMSVAVELEPEMAETGKGRRRPKGFSVLTSTYDRKTDDGTEEVTQPAIGYVSQASGNFFSTLVSYDEAGEFEGTVFKIKRTDDKTYVFTPYLDQDVDLTNLIENIEGISYISRDEDTWEDLEPKLANAEDDESRALLTAVALLERRLNELADADAYREKTDHIEKIESKYGNDNNGSSKRTERPARQSQRRGATAEKSESDEGGKTERSKQRFGEILAMAEKSKK